MPHDLLILKKQGKRQTYAQETVLCIQDEFINISNNLEYVTKVVQRNNIKPNNIPNEKTVTPPKAVHNIKKIVSVVGMIRVNWNEVKNHQVDHAKNKYDARKELLAKGNSFADARIRYAIFHIQCKLGILISKLGSITETW